MSKEQIGIGASETDVFATDKVTISTLDSNGNRQVMLSVGRGGIAKKINYGRVIMQEMATMDYSIADPSGGTLNMAGFLAACTTAKGSAVAVGDLVGSVNGDSTNGFFAALKAPYAFCSDDIWRIDEITPTPNVSYYSQSFEYYLSVLSFDGKSRGITFNVSAPSGDGSYSVSYTDSMVIVNYTPDAAYSSFKMSDLMNSIKDDAANFPFVLGGNVDGSEVPRSISEAPFSNMFQTSQDNVFWYDYEDTNAGENADAVPPCKQLAGLLRWVPIGGSSDGDVQFACMTHIGAFWKSMHN